ncbi:ankyrin [Dothidotthia symphoricarpi CBS 119687]|uniref:Ankyrin n=1 Tax=Dothidotthia symphoricarpi CBS 119687 TaxID=1392245 RepID=A0A6A6AGR1_9PLEO|nr:ankyrin [Dothidotthia symphoricarpi CBS 119687]KAF2129621.1 ankyrin [Dothidotthia symphoricarpi CBS 119687]
MQSSATNPSERRKIQNRHAQRRFRSKKVTQNAGEPFTTTALSAAATVSGPAIRPRLQSNHDALAWTGLANPPEKAAWGSEERLPHPSVAGPQTSDQNQDLTPTTAKDSRTMRGKSDAAYLGPDATIAGLMRQFQDPLTPSSLQPHLHMNQTDFTFSSSMAQSIRDPLQWPHDAPAEAMVFNAHDTGGFYSNQDTNKTPWPDTGASHHQLTRSTQNESESSSDTSQSHTRITTPNLLLNGRFGQDSELDEDEPFQTNLHIAAEAGHDSLVGLLLGSGYTVDALDSDGNTALHRASLGKHVKVMLRLLKHGANPNSVNVHGWTPVHMAFSLGSMEVVEVLVRHGGDLNKRAKGKLSCATFKEALAAKTS